MSDGNATAGPPSPPAPPAPTGTLSTLNHTLFLGGDFTSTAALAVVDGAGAGTTGALALNIAQWNGSTWFALRGGVQGTAQALHVHGRRLYVGGDFEWVDANSVYVRHIACWDGDHWSPLAGGVVGASVYALASVGGAAAPGSVLLVGGSLLSATGVAVTALARWDGVAWASVPGVSAGVVRDLAATSASTVCAAGSLLVATPAGAEWVTIACWDADSGIWSLLRGQFSATVFALAWLNGTTLAAAGSFAAIDGAPVSRVALWDGTAWKAVCCDHDDDGFADGSTSDVYALYAPADGSDALFAGGAFASVINGNETLSAPRLTAWAARSTTWRALATAALNQGPVFAIAPYRGSLAVCTSTGPGLYTGSSSDYAGPVHSLFSFTSSCAMATWNDDAGATTECAAALAGACNGPCFVAASSLSLTGAGGSENGTACAPCLHCGVHAGCAADGSCACAYPFAGATCTSCANATLHGAQCLPLPWILSVTPLSGPTTGGTVITLVVQNVASGSGVHRCRFGGTVVGATYTAGSATLVCTSPVTASGLVSLEISDDGGATYSSNGYYFSFVEQCLNNCNGVDRGLCSLGQCYCRLPWAGADCSVLLAPPVVTAVVYGGWVDPIEAVPWTSVVPTGLQGSSPLQWTLVDGTAPAGLVVDSQTGRLSWPSPRPANEPYQVQVRVTNAVGSAQLTRQVTVVFIYTAALDTSSMATDSTLPPGSLKILSGNATFVATGLPAPGRPIKVVVLLRGQPRTLTGYSGFGGRFQLGYLSPLNEGGRYSAYAAHPLQFVAPPPSTWLNWTVTSVTFSPTSSTATLLTGTPVSQAATALRNNGDDDVAVTLAWAVQDSATTLAVDSLAVWLGNISLPASPPAGTTGTLLPAQVVQTITIVHSGDGVGLLTLVLTVNVTSPIAWSTQFWFTLRLDPLRAQLSLSPSSLSVTAVSGLQRIASVVISNTGRSSTGPIALALPPNPLLALGVAQPLPSLGVGQSTVVTFVLTPAIDLVGTATGSVGISCADDSVALPFTIVLVQNATAALTVSVEDELTYFSVGSPRVANATVYLSANSLTVAGIVSYTGLTDATGRVTFDSVPFGTYSVRVSEASTAGEHRASTAGARSGRARGARIG